ncbi:MAG TPA: DUF2652 domain-containing protein, partial [Anaerolineae bacterium]
MSTTQQGFLLIADITGYTMYLSQSELEHAQEVLQSLLELLIDHTRPPLIISRLAGDAVISYALQGTALQGQTFVESIENTYLAFRRAIELMVLNNTCQCAACANVASLDLKFFIHYGTFGIQRLGEHDELVGSDVNLIHRLLKNHVTAQTGIQAYTLYTEAAVRQLGIEDIGETMTAHVEEYEHLGKVKTRIQDMHPVWQAKRDQTRIELAPDDVLAHNEGEFSLPVHLMWEIVADPDYRSIFVQSVRQQILSRQNGRLAPGSAYLCFHGGKRVTTQTILEWQAFEQMTTEDTTPVPGATVLVNIRLTPTESGTRMAITCSKARGPFLSRLVCNFVGGFLVRAQFRKGMQAFQA